MIRKITANDVHFVCERRNIIFPTLYIAFELTSRNGFFGRGYMATQQYIIHHIMSGDTVYEVTDTSTINHLKRLHVYDA